MYAIKKDVVLPCTHVFLISGLSGYVAVDVYDVVNYHVVGGDNKKDADYTRTQHALTATWRTRQANGDMPIKYDFLIAWRCEIKKSQQNHC